MKTRLIKIGDEQGIFIPEELIERFALGAEVELEIQPDQLIIRPVKRPREGWKEQFRKMAQAGDDKLLDEEAVSLTEWDDKEWQW